VKTDDNLAATEAFGSSAHEIADATLEFAD
jgi:hypothetical protein